MGSPRTMQLRVMGALLAGIGIFVYTSPAPPDAATLAELARCSELEETSSSVVTGLLARLEE